MRVETVSESLLILLEDLMSCQQNHNFQMSFKLNLILMKMTYIPESFIILLRFTAFPCKDRRRGNMYYMLGIGLDIFHIVVHGLYNI